MSGHTPWAAVKVVDCATCGQRHAGRRSTDHVEPPSEFWKALVVMALLVVAGYLFVMATVGSSL